MSATYEFKCTPPNEAARVVRIEAASFAEAEQRATALWCRQMHRPILLCRIDHEPQVALIDDYQVRDALARMQARIEEN